MQGESLKRTSEIDAISNSHRFILEANRDMVIKKLEQYGLVDEARNYMNNSKIVLMNLNKSNEVTKPNKSLKLFRGNDSCNFYKEKLRLNLKTSKKLMEQ
jgi:predicted Mrr-cat superfamily restriction endonuclease